MLASSQHEVDVRVARYLARLDGGTAGRKAQFFLDTIAWAWGPEHLSCFKGTKWRPVPSVAAVVTVAGYASSHRPTCVRTASLAAIAQTGDLANVAIDAIRTALLDADRCMRLAAARTAAEACLGDPLGKELRAVLRDDVWAVRWHAVRALVAHAYDAELGELARILVATTPGGGMALTAWAHAVEAVRPRCRACGQNEELDEHVGRMLGSLSVRDRDFVWPITK